MDCGFVACSNMQSRMTTGKSFQLVNQAYSGDLEELVNDARDSCRYRSQAANTVRTCEMADRRMCYNASQLSVIGKIAVNLATILDGGNSSLPSCM